MNKWIELLLGLVIFVGIILVGWASYVYGWTIFGKDFNLMSSAWILLKGTIFWIIVLLGLLLILLGINDLKE